MTAEFVGGGEPLGLTQQVELFGGAAHGCGESRRPGGLADDAHVLDEDVQAAEDLRAAFRVGLEDAGPRLESIKEPAAPASRAASVLAWSRPRASARAIASAAAAMWIPQSSWLTVLRACPSPGLSPTTVRVEASSSRTGRADSSACGSAPTTISRSPSPARFGPPESGASTRQTPYSASRRRWPNGVGADGAAEDDDGARLQHGGDAVFAEEDIVQLLAVADGQEKCIRAPPPLPGRRRRCGPRRLLRAGGGARRCRSRGRSGRWQAGGHGQPHGAEAEDGDLVVHGFLR